jgi:arylsulfatase A-like enzyme
MPVAERLARQGLTYCQFHTTGLCAPTRAALLTGRNHHSASTGIVQEMATGFPGYCGILPRSCATIAEILSPNGYATGWWGKKRPFIGDLGASPIMLHVPRLPADRGSPVL